MNLPGEVLDASKGECVDLEEDFQDDLDGFSDAESDMDDYFLPVDYELEVDSTFPLSAARKDSQQYQYSKLQQETQFRLLVLKAGGGGADRPIECELRIESLEDEACPQFEALSYTWGERNDLFKIWVEGKFIRVTGNLRDALQNLRHDHQDRVLWVDAVCINQSAELEGRSDGEELDEKTMQVRQMGSIYEKASSVLIWLGLTRSEDDQLSDGHLQEDHFSRFLDTRWAQKNQMEYWELRWANWPHERNEVRESLQNLLRHDWFDRVWIVQEVARSQSAFIHRGKQCVPAGIFAQLPQLLGVEPEPHCQQILNIMPRIRDVDVSQSRDCDTSRVWVPRQLRDLLHDFQESKSSREEDKIYALLGLSIEQGRANGALAIDYSKTEKQVVHDTIDILYPGLLQRKSPNWTLAEFWRQLDTLESALLTWAVVRDYDTVVGRLLETAGTTASSPITDMQLRAEYFSALERGRAKVLKILLETGRVDVNSRNDEGHTPLDIASNGRSNRANDTIRALLRA